MSLRADIPVGESTDSTTTIKDRLSELQSQSQALEIDATARQIRMQEVSEYAEAYIDGIDSRAVYIAPPGRASTMQAMQLSDEPGSLEDALNILREHVDSTGQNIGSARFFAYIPSGGLYDVALADYIAGVINRYSGVGHASPGAARMEEVLLRWLADVLGYPDNSEGDLTSGGSMAALSAVVTAREAFSIRSATVGEHVVYLTSQMHHTFRKALHIAGLSDCVLREIPQDDGYRMRPDALEQAIADDKAKGQKPWFVAASAGTTDVGAVDPLDQIADIAKAEGLWFHVDAAYGGAFALCDIGRQKLKGIERSDSLIIDPHKGFFLQGGVGVLLVRDGNNLRRAFHGRRGTYMQDVLEDPERSPCDLSPELTRPFRALRFWLPFKLLGIAAFSTALEEKLLLAQYFRQRVMKIDGIVVGPAPDLSIVTFRAVADSRDPDELTKQLMKRVNDDGRMYVTSTVIDGRFTIRMAILGYNTHIEDVDIAIDLIAETLGELSGT